MAATKDKREQYGVETLAPILELMVSDILRELPADPQAFMKQWLAKPPVDGQCYVDILREQMKKMQHLQDGDPAEAMASIAAAKPEVQIAAKHIVDKSILEGCRMEGELSSSSAIAEAPFIHQFFKVVGGIVGEVVMADEYESMFDGEKGMMMGSMEWQKNNIVARMERIQTEGPPLLAKSFRHHDSDGDDVLNRDEAAKFFSHVVSEEGPFLHMVVSAVHVKTCHMMRMMADEPGDARNKEMMRESAADYNANKEMIKKMKAAYLANKADRDLAAFKVCDTNGDGTLQLDEVVAALMPGGNKNDAFIAALGFESMGQQVLDAMVNFECSDGECSGGE